MLAYEEEGYISEIITCYYKNNEKLKLSSLKSS